jgi:RecB family endonuclease NucS
LDGSHFRLYEAATDPAPITKGGSDDAPRPELPAALPDDSSQFAYEHDLRDFLARNLGILEAGLRLYQDEGITGVEFPVGGRSIDILALDRANNYVVVELKVSKGYDRAVGQLLRYMAWIEEHQADAGQSVRGFIIAKTISQDLILACSRVSGVQLFEYDLSVTLRSIEAKPRRAGA